MISCKKDTTEGKTDVLTGAWEEVPQKAYSKRLLFESGGKFSMQVRDKDNQYWSLVISGNYSVSSDNLSVTTTNETVKSSAGTVVSTNLINYKLFENGKFSIDNFILTLNYTTYPADGPVPTTSKFNKLIPID